MIQPDAASPLPRRAWAGIVLVLVALFLNFWIQTKPVRLATSDDVEFQGVADGGKVEEYLATLARGQGRFFYSTPLYRFALFSPYEIRSEDGFALLRAVALFAQVGLAAWLAGRVFHSAALGAAVALLLAGTLHFPLTFFLVLSFPPVWIGFSALLGALHCHWTHLQRPTAWSGLLPGALFLLATLMHDVFIIFLPVFAALSPLQKWRWVDLFRRNLAPLAVAAGYVLVHRNFSANFPTAYEGTKFSLELVPAAQVLIRQLIGVIPGLELVINRLPAETTGPLFRDLPAVWATLHQLTWLDFLLAAGTGLALGVACGFGLKTSLPATRFWPWAVGCAALANLPIALSAKYQVFILHREFPYGYAWFSFCFLGIAAVAAFFWSAQWLPVGKPRLMLAGAAGTVVFLLSLSAAASNHRVLQILQERYN